MADLARSNDQPLAASNTDLSTIDNQPIDVHPEPEEGWQVIMHDENEGKMVIVNQQTKELDIYVSVTRSRWAGQMRNKPLAAPSSETTGDNDTCPVCHQTVTSTVHEHGASDELALAVPHTEDQVYVDRDYFAALTSVSEAAPIAPPTAAPEPAPSRLAHLMNGGYYRRFFQEDKRLGSGGYGAVYLVRHQIRGVDLGHYALKKVPCGEDEEWLVRVLREVTVLQALTKHPHLVNYKHAWLELDQIADFGPQVPCLFILMEYANSGNLYDYVVRSQVQLSVAELRLRKRRGDLLAAVALTHELVWSFFLDILLGLDCMHACDMIHHDLKPQNILLHATTNNGNVRGGTESAPVITCLISDFGTSEALKGIAVASEQDAEQRNNHLGTLEWLAPEVVRETINSPNDAADQQVRMSGDIWSLGMILYFMLCKRLPYQNSTLDQILDMEALKREISEFKHVTYPAECTVPEDLKALVELMLRPNPRDRPTTQQLLSHVTVVQKLAALHRTMSYHESIVQHNVREVSTTQLARDPPPPPRDQSRDQLALSTDSISLTDSTSSLPRLITPPMTRRASDIHTRPTPQTSTATEDKNSAPKKDPGRTKFSNRFSRQNARASSYFKPNSFANGIPSSGIPRSPRASNNIPSSFMASPPPSLGSTPLPSYDDLFEYFKTNKLVPNLQPSTATSAAAGKVTPVNTSLAPTWKQAANLLLFLLRLAQSAVGCSALARTNTSHQFLFVLLAAVTLLLSVHKRTKIPQIVITCLLWLWTISYYLSGYYCTPLLADLAAEPLTAPSPLVLLYATVCYALSLVLLFADQQIERALGWGSDTSAEAKEQSVHGNEVDWNAVAQRLQQLKKRR